jgi:hypothetical protein
VRKFLVVALVPVVALYGFAPVAVLYPFTLVLAAAGGAALALVWKSDQGPGRGDGRTDDPEIPPPDGIEIDWDGELERLVRHHHDVPVIE